MSFFAGLLSDAPPPQPFPQSAAEQDSLLTLLDILVPVFAPRIGLSVGVFLLYERRRFLSFVRACVRSFSLGAKNIIYIYDFDMV